MIISDITREDALKILELGFQMHQESRYKSRPYNREMIWAYLNATKTLPQDYFIVYNKEKDDSINAFFLMKKNVQHFSGEAVACDMGIYVSPEKRGSSIFFKMLRAVESWAKTSECTRIVLYSSAGINSEQTKHLFPKLGYTHFGYIFDKEI